MSNLNTTQVVFKDGLTQDRQNVASWVDITPTEISVQNEPTTRYRVEREAFRYKKIPYEVPADPHEEIVDGLAYKHKVVRGDNVYTIRGDMGRLHPSSPSWRESVKDVVDNVSQVVTDRVVETSVTFWDAIRKMANNAIARWFAIVLTPAVIVGLVALASATFWGKLWNGILNTLSVSFDFTIGSILPFVGWVLLGVLVISVPAAALYGLLWLVTPSKPSGSVELPKIAIGEGKRGKVYGLIVGDDDSQVNIDIPASQESTHQVLLSHAKRIAFLKVRTPMLTAIAGLVLPMSIFVLPNIIDQDVVVGTSIILSILGSVAALSHMVTPISSDDERAKMLARDSLVIHLKNND